MAIFNGKTHYKWPFSIAMLNYQRVQIRVTFCPVSVWKTSTYPGSSMAEKSGTRHPCYQTEVGPDSTIKWSMQRGTPDFFIFLQQFWDFSPNLRGWSDSESNSESAVSYREPNSSRGSTWRIIPRMARRKTRSSGTMYLCIYVCMYVRMYVRVCVCVYVCPCASVFITIYLCCILYI